MERGSQITAHCMVRNEPFIYYAVMSVYDYVDYILLYDTGSNDDHTLNDIHTLLSRDVLQKISFRKIPKVYDSRLWTRRNYEKIASGGNIPLNIGDVRQMMIDETRTLHFLIVDGDEVYYQSTLEAIMRRLRNQAYSNFPIFIPRVEFATMDSVIPTQQFMGRVFFTPRTAITSDVIRPKFIHRLTHVPFIPEKSVQLPLPIAHFAPFLKPGRYDVSPDSMIPFRGDLPEVMLQTPAIMQRVAREGNKRAYTTRV